MLNLELTHWALYINHYSKCLYWWLWAMTTFKVSFAAFVFFRQSLLAIGSGVWSHSLRVSEDFRWSVAVGREVSRLGVKSQGCRHADVLISGRGGGGGKLTREKVRGTIVHKAGRKYQHDWLYLQSINSDKPLSAKSLYRSIFLDDDILLWCLYMYRQSS
jgi:hypothetical protein